MGEVPEGWRGTGSVGVIPTSGQAGTSDALASPVARKLKSSRDLLPSPSGPAGHLPHARLRRRLDGGGLRFLSRQRLDRQQIIEPQGSNRLRPTFPRTALHRMGEVPEGRRGTGLVEVIPTFG